MRRLFLIPLVAVLFIESSRQAPAQADSVWAVTRNGNPVASITLTDAQQTRLAQWAVGTRKGSVVQTPAVAPVLDAQGNVVTPGSPAVMRDPTPAEAVQFMAAGFFTDMLAKATDWYKQNAAKSAADAVAPVQ